MKQQLASRKRDQQQEDARLMRFHSKLALDHGSVPEAPSKEVPYARSRELQKAPRPEASRMLNTHTRVWLEL